MTADELGCWDINCIGCLNELVIGQYIVNTVAHFCKVRLNGPLLCCSGSSSAPVACSMYTGSIP